VLGSDAVITVSDIAGKTIKSVKVDNNIISVDMKELANGIYMIRYTDSEHSQNIKVNKH